MTELWTKVPQWLALDAGVLALPAPAQVSLYRIAMAGGNVSCGADPVGALDALCAGAGSSLDDMRGLGVLSLEGRRLYLMAPDGLPSAVGATETARGGAPASSTLDASRDAADALRKRLSGLWAKANAKTLDARLAWLDGAAGAAFVARERLTHEAVAEMTRATTGSARGRFGSGARGSNRKGDGSNHGSNFGPVGAVTAPTTVPTGSPSQTLPLRKNEERSGENARVAVPTTAPTCGSNQDDGWNRDGSNFQPAAPTVEHVGAKIEPDVILGAMGRASGGLVSMAGSAPELVAFRDALRGYVAQGFAIERITAATSHLAHDHWTQRQRRTGLSASRLVAAGHNGRPSILTELLAESETCPKCSAASAPAAPKPAAPIVRPKPASPAEARRAIEAARAKPAAEGEGHV